MTHQGTRPGLEAGEFFFVEPAELVA
jgi:hypothetical protein